MQNTKHLYECVNRICSSKGQKQRDIAQVKLSDGTITNNEEEISETFNRHYISYGQELASRINKLEYRDNIIPLDSTLFLRPLTEPETVEIIGQLKNNKSPGLDGITARSLKEIKDEIKEPLTFVINKIMELGVWPSLFGVGVVTPIFKCGDPLEVANYRPITVISNLAKVAEKVLKRRICDFLDKNDILSSQQFGFREARSTQDAISFLVDNLYKSIDANKPTLCLFVDLAKAFDTVSHEILLDKMEKYGFRGVAHSLIKSYLGNRTQHVRIGGTLSEAGKVRYGVPQGTVLGPILFILYINDLLTLQSAGRIISYADDTAIMYTENSWEKLKETVECDFLTIKRWFDTNLLTLNPTKTTFLTFSAQVRETFDCILIKETEGTLQIKSSASVKYLGIIVDSQLKWSLHINNVVKKLRPLLFKFRVLRQYLDVAQLRILYFALVRSHLSYGVIAWGSAFKTHLRNLEIIQKWFLKIMYGKVKTYPSDLLYTETHILDIRQLFCYTVLCRQYQHKNHIDLVDHRYGTRQRGVLCRTAMCRKKIGQRNHLYIGQKLFNVLPQDIRESTSLSIYKRRVKDWMFSNTRGYIHELVDNID